MSIKNIIPIFLVVCLLFLAGCGSNPRNIFEAEASSEPEKRQLMKEIVLVPLGDFPISKVEELVEYYQNKYNLKVKTVPPLKIEQSAMDPQRGQLIAEEAIEMMKWGYPRLSGDPRPIMIGLTDVDMFIRERTWQFTFSWRVECRFAVVSNARMNLYASSVSPEKLSSRLRKMVTKNIGIMYYDLYETDNPRSVLYGRIGGIEELDFMGEDF